MCPFQKERGLGENFIKLGRQTNSVLSNRIFQTATNPVFVLPLIDPNTDLFSKTSALGIAFLNAALLDSLRAALSTVTVDESKRPTPEQYRLSHKARFNHYGLERFSPEDTERRLFEAFDKPHTASQRYDLIAIGIEQLWNLTPPITKANFDGEIFRPKDPPHGFTTYEVNWKKTPLPPRVKDFLRPSRNKRVNITVQDFTIPKFERYKQDGEEYKCTIGQNDHHIIWLSNERGQIELHIKKGSYDGGSIYDECMAEREFDLKFLPIGPDGKLILDDPRNVHVDYDRIPTDSLIIAKKILQTAFRERNRQLS